MVLRESLWLAIAGIAMAVPATALVARVLIPRLFGVGAFDPPAIALAATLMIAVAAMAGLVPARRASRVDPMVALKCD